MFDLVNQVLKSLGLEIYQDDFEKNELDDETVQEFISDGYITSALQHVIPIAAKRIRFISKFKSIILNDSKPASTHNVFEDTELNVEVDPKQVVAAKEGSVKEQGADELPRPLGPRPVQIIQMEKDSSLLVCLENELSTILNKTGKRPIAVIGIIGPPQSGKSEFLNFVLRRLYGLQNDTIDWMGWMSEVICPEFSCLSNEDDEVGIWMWPEPVTLQSKKLVSNTEFDVLIMETRGCFDAKREPSEWVKFLGLSLLTTSCLLLNICQDIDDKFLEIIKEFVSFGLSIYMDRIMVDNKIQKAFQKIAFLIRDWDRSDEYPYGSKGGDSFIVKNHSETHTKLKKCFDEIACILIPPAGSNQIGMKLNAFSSSVVFAQTVETVIEDIVNISALSMKNVNINSITGQDLMQLIKNCVALFNEEDLLDSDLIEILTTQCSNSVVISRCLLSFTEAMKSKLAEATFISDDDLKGYHKDSEQKALSVFKKMNKVGSRRAIDKLEDELCDQMNIRFEQFRKQNSDNRQEVLSRAHEDAVSKYSKAMEELESTQKQFLEDDDLIKASKSAEDEAMDIFDSVIKHTNSEDVLREKMNIQNSIEAKSKEFTSLYMQRKNEAEKLMNEELGRILTFYKQEMSKQINGESVSDKQLQEFHAPILKKCTEILLQNQSASLLYFKGQDDLSSMLRNELLSLQEQIRRNHHNLIKKCETLVTETVEFYKEKMKSVAQTDDDELRAAHNQMKEDAVEKLRSSEIIPSEKKPQFVSELKCEIQAVFTELLIEFQKNKRTVEEAIRLAIKEAKTSYKEAMDPFVSSSNNPIDETRLKARHQHEKLQANKQLQGVYRGLEDNLKNAKEHEATGLNELNASIEKLFIEFERSNELKWKNFESSANVSFATAKSEYCDRVKKITVSCFDEEVLKQKEIQVRAETEGRFLEKLNPKVAKRAFLQEMVESFKKYMDAHFSECLDDFKTQLEEDEVTVRAALMEARQYYNDEMSKRFSAKDWFDSEELSRINTELTERAITIAKKEVPLEEHQEKYLREVMEGVYVKYVEENIRKRPVENPAIGIDLGTTYSCVGVFINGEVKIIPDKDVGEATTFPSYVAFKADHTIVVGEAAKSQAFLDPLNTIFDAKRLIGRSFDDPVVQKDVKLWPFDVVGEKNIPKIKVRGKTFHPEQISAKVILKMKQIAENYLKKKVYQAIVTVPAYFNDGQRKATRDAARIAGLKVTVLNEPTAAAMAYKLHRTDDLKRNVLIFDLGGGTFDVAVLEMKKGEINVKATGGDTHLGGEDFDNNMVDAIIERVKRKHGIDLGRDRNSSDTFKKSRAAYRLRRLRDQCEIAKKNLSSASSFRMIMDTIDGNFNLEETFTKVEFERLNNHLFQKCIMIVKDVLKDANLDKGKVDDIVLVGGSTRIPKVRELLKQFFDGKKELCSTVNADEAVARGAAIQAALLNEEQAPSVAGIKLSDVTPLSIGIENSKLNMSVVIPKNTPVPCNRMKDFYTVINNQTEVPFNIYEGELPVAADNNLLGKFLLKGVPSAPAGREPLDCTMKIDKEGILHCKAVSRSNGKSNDIKIETYNGRMSSAEIADAQLIQTKEPSYATIVLHLFGRRISMVTPEVTLKILTQC